MVDCVKDLLLVQEHRDRLSVWGLGKGRLSLDPPTEYETEVAGLAKSALHGSEEIEAHPHQNEEMGMCAVCDAAAVVQRILSK